jgi:hypothetical protein
MVALFFDFSQQMLLDLIFGPLQLLILLSGLKNMNDFFC